MDAAQMAQTLTRMAHEILEKNPGEQSLAVVGIHTRGAVLAQRLRDLLAQLPDATCLWAPWTSASTATT